MRNPLATGASAAALAALLVISLAGDCWAQHQVRRRFDPEDLKLEEPGVVHADVAFGAVRGQLAGRWLVPDFDVDVGLAPKVELGLDGSWSLEGTPSRLFALDHPAPDNLWLSSKLGLWGGGREDEATGWALGAQLGPRVALAPDTHGTGFQAVGLVGLSRRRLNVVLNGGGLVDPGGAVSSQRPVAALAGFDLALSLDEKASWTLNVDLSGVFFARHGNDQNDQLVTTAGPLWAVSPWLDLGVYGLLGFLSGGDRYGAYLTVAPKFKLF